MPISCLKHNIKIYRGKCFLENLCLRNPSSGAAYEKYQANTYIDGRIAGLRFC
jgi:hypothetical protein